MAGTRPELLTGWGRTSPSRAEVLEVPVDPQSPGRLADEWSALQPARGALARGLGRSYGDAAQCGGGVVLRLTPSGGPAIQLDPPSRTVTAHAGVSIDEVLRVILPEGWFVPVTPGTRYVTVGGAVACDVHGKNHHVDGSFGRHVRAMRMMLASGEVVDLTPATDPDLWWATIGGMGLTGVILSVTFEVLAVETTQCSVDTDRAANLEELLVLMAEGDHRYRYSVAWVDLLATGRSLGRSVLTRGDHAPLDQLGGDRSQRDPRAFAPRSLAAVPPGVPNLLTRASVQAFNEVWFRRAPRRRRGELQHLARFFHPLDGVGHWNRLYGRHGFLQYQFVVPLDADATLREVVERVATSGHASFLAVLKRFGPGTPGLLSFPFEGWTLTLDLPARASGLASLLRHLDDLVLDAGGRHYLAKDAHTTPEAIRRGYPRLGEWQAIQRRVDPDGRWCSDQARRLRLLEEEPCATR